VKKVELSKGGPSLSQIVYGVWTWDQVKPEHREALFKTALDHGITSFDSADIYGGYTNEANLGEVISHHSHVVPRDSIQIVSKTDICLVNPNRPEHHVKFYNTSKEHIVSSAKRSVELHRSHYLDLYLIHRPDPLINPEEVAEAFLHLKKEGLVKHFGVSNFTPAQFASLASYLPPDTPLVTNQVQLSPTFTKLLWDGTFDQALERRFKPMIWSPLRGLFGDNETPVNAVLKEVGAQVGAGEDEVALAWSLRIPSNPVVVIGTSKTDRVALAAKATTIHLDRQQWFKILQVGEGKEIP